jgi:hypothetical protein
MWGNGEKCEYLQTLAFSGCAFKIHKGRREEFFKLYFRGMKKSLQIEEKRDLKLIEVKSHWDKKKKVSFCLSGLGES